MRYASAALLSISLLSAGCASWFMNGGTLKEAGFKPTVKSSFTVPTCAMRDGSSLAGPANMTFQLVQDGPEVGIFERGADGSGALITNRWSDDKADHYFGWVQSSGWEYVVPKDPAVQPTRVVYVGLHTKKEGNATKPASPVAATCPMVAAK